MTIEVPELEKLLYSKLVPGDKSIKVSMLIARSIDIGSVTEDSLVNAALEKLSKRADIVVYGINIENWRRSEIRRLIDPSGEVT